MSTVPLSRLGLSDGVLDGPFLRPDRTLGLLLSLRGTGGGDLPSPSEVAWPRELPKRAKTDGVRVYVRVDGAALDLGPARVVRRGVLLLAEPLADDVWRKLVEDARRPPEPPPEEGIVALGPNPSTSDRLGALRTFTERWWGPAEPEAGPPVLRECARIRCVQNRFVPPEPNTRVFYVENQGVCSWAAEGDGDDPPVVRWMDGVRARESDSLSAFLLGVALTEALFAAPWGASIDGLDRAGWARVKRKVPPMPSLRWAASGVEFVGGEGVVGMAYPNADGWDVWLGAVDPVRWERIEGLVADWPT